MNIQKQKSKNDTISIWTSPADVQEKLTTKYRSYVGMLNWLATSTRPEITTVVFSLSVQTNQSTYHARQICTSLFKINYQPRYQFPTQECIPPPRKLHTHIPFDKFEQPSVFTDANWGPQDASHPTNKNQRMVSLEETKSVCGFIVFMQGAPIMWKAFKEARGSRSSCAAEIKTIDKCVKAV